MSGDGLRLFRRPVRIDADSRRAFLLHGGRVVLLMERYEKMTMAQWQALVDFVAKETGATPVVDDVTREI